jgi:hypothetical protein
MPRALDRARGYVRTRVARPTALVTPTLCAAASLGVGRLMRGQKTLAYRPQVAVQGLRLSDRARAPVLTTVPFARAFPLVTAWRRRRLQRTNRGEPGPELWVSTRSWGRVA